MDPADLVVTSTSFRRDAECPDPSPKQLCVLVSVKNQTSSLLRNVYLQITSMEPAEPGANVADYVGKNNDVILPAHAAALDGPRDLGMWWVGHIAPGAERRFTMVLKNPEADFNFQAQMWGDDQPACTVDAAQTVAACQVAAAEPSQVAFIDGFRGADRPCPPSPVPEEYPNDDSQGAVGCGNGSLRRPFATLGAALAQRGPRATFYLAGAPGRPLEERTTLALEGPLRVVGGFASIDGFASRATPTPLLVRAVPGIRAAEGAITLERIELSTVSLAGLGSSASNVALLVDRNATVSLSGMRIAPGNAAEGRGGTSTSGAVPTGAAGKPAFRGRGGVAGAAPTCPTDVAPISMAGAGGDGGYGEEDGRPGVSASQGDAMGGAGGRTETPDGMPGEPGRPGWIGAHGAPATSDGGLFDADGTYAPLVSGSGQAGARGGGGAGGGGARGFVRDRIVYRGVGGSGGGSGGCGGRGGEGGGGGGATMAIEVLRGGRVTFDGERSVLRPGRGGAGGNGGDGQSGARGGAGGAASTSDGLRGGAGGAGGDGGPGGGGAGGAGGPAACLVVLGGDGAGGDVTGSFDCSLPMPAQGGEGGRGGGSLGLAPNGPTGALFETWRLP